MKRSSSLRTVLIAGVAIALVAIGAAWSIRAPMSLTGLGLAYPRARDTQIDFIRSRVAHPIVSPEWIAVDGLEARWIIYEVAARFGLTISVAVALFCMLTWAQKKKDPNQTLEPTAPSGRGSS